MAVSAQIPICMKRRSSKQRLKSSESISGRLARVLQWRGRWFAGGIARFAGPSCRSLISGESEKALAYVAGMGLRRSSLFGL